MRVHMKVEIFFKKKKDYGNNNHTLFFNSTWAFSRTLHRDYGICCSTEPWKVSLTGTQRRRAAQIFRYRTQGHGQLPPASLPKAKLLGFLVLGINPTDFKIKNLSGTKRDALLNCPQTQHTLLSVFVSKLTSLFRLVFTPTW